MRRVPLAFAALALFLGVTAVSAQSKPDFSGSWKAIASTARADGASLTVVQDETTITMTFPEADGKNNRLSLKLDGTPGKYAIPRGDGTTQERDARAEWSDRKLVISLKAYANKLGDYTIKQTWSLDGERLMVETVSISDATGVPITSPGSTTFRRQ